MERVLRVIVVNGPNAADAAGWQARLPSVQLLFAMADREAKTSDTADKRSKQTLKKGHMVVESEDVTGVEPMGVDDVPVGPATKPRKKAQNESQQNTDAADAHGDDMDKTGADVVVVRALLVRVLTLYSRIWPRSLAETKVDLLKLTGAAEKSMVASSSAAGAGAGETEGKAVAAVTRCDSGLAMTMAPELRAPVLSLMQSAR